MQQYFMVITSSVDVFRKSLKASITRVRNFPYQQVNLIQFLPAVACSPLNTFEKQKSSVTQRRLQRPHRKSSYECEGAF